MWFLRLSDYQRAVLPLGRSSSTSECAQNPTETRRPQLQYGQCGCCSQMQARAPPPKGDIKDSLKVRFSVSLSPLSLRAFVGPSSLYQPQHTSENSSSTH